MSLLARFRAAVPASRINLFVHAGNSLAVCASVSEDMIHLRSFMIGATASGMCFNLLQPKPLWTPVYWGCFFASMHAYQIGKILRETASCSLSEREHALYEDSFLPHGFTPRQFLRLMETGKFVTLAPGEMCALEGEPVQALHLVTRISQGASVELQHFSQLAARDGSSTLRRADSTAGVLSRVEQASLGCGGLWVGDVWYPGLETRHTEQPRPQTGSGGVARGARASPIPQAVGGTWNASVQAVGGPVEAVRFECAAFHDALHELGSGARTAAERMQIAALQAERAHLSGFASQVQARNSKRLRALEERHLREQTVATYRGMVALAVVDGFVSDEVPYFDRTSPSLVAPHPCSPSPSPLLSVCSPSLVPDRHWQELAACRAFRAAHAIGDEQHRDALRAAGVSDEQWQRRRTRDAPAHASSAAFAAASM
jgi:hypothetical protein